MKMILSLLSFLMISIVQVQVYAADPESCRGVNLDQFRNSAVPAGSPPEQMYKFDAIKTQLIQSIRQQRNSAQCYTDFYQNALTENSQYWGRTLALEGCVVNDNGTISSTSTLSALGVTCNSANAARNSLERMNRLDQQLRGENQAIQEASEVLEDAAAEARAGGTGAEACQARRAPTATAEQLRENICCGPTARSAAGAIGALEPGITRNSCLSKIRPTNRRILSGGALGSCLAGIARSAINTFISNIGSIVSLPGQLWAARAQIWSLMTSAAAREKFMQQIKQAVQQFIGDRVNAVRSCYNGYEIAQYGCRVAGQLVGNFFTGGTVGTVLNLVARPATIALRGLGQILARSQAAGRMQRAAQIVRQGASTAARGARAVDQRTGRVVSGSSRAVTAASRVIARPLTGSVRRASNLIAQAPPYRRLLLSAYRFERRQVQATRDFRRANPGRDVIEDGDKLVLGAAAGTTAVASRADDVQQILPPEGATAQAGSAATRLGRTLDFEQGDDGVYRMAGDTNNQGQGQRTTTNVAAEDRPTILANRVEERSVSPNSRIDNSFDDRIDPPVDRPRAPDRANQLPVVIRNNERGLNFVEQSRGSQRISENSAPPPANLIDANSNSRGPPNVDRRDISAQAPAPSNSDGVSTAIARAQPNLNDGATNLSATSPNTNGAATNLRPTAMSRPADPQNLDSQIRTQTDSANRFSTGSIIRPSQVNQGGSALRSRSNADLSFEEPAVTTNVGRATNENVKIENRNQGTVALTNTNTRALNSNRNIDNGPGPQQSADVEFNLRSPAQDNQVSASTNGAPSNSRNSVFGQRPRLKTPEEQVNFRLEENDRERFDSLKLSSLRDSDLQFAPKARYDDVRPKGNGPRISERQQTNIEIENQLARMQPETRKEVFDFIERTPQNLRNNHFAALLNSKDPAATMRRLNLTNKSPVVLSRRAALRQIDNEIAEQTRQMQRLPDGSAERLNFAQNRSALLFERTIIDLGDKIEVRNIFSANTHNRYFEVEKKYEPHSLANTFNADIEIKKDGVRVCRGSYATEGALSSVHGGFFTLCRSQGYLDRKTNSDVLAAPTDQTLPDLEQGVSVYSSFNARVGARMSLGQNGPVRYDKDGEVINGSGGNGGSIEFFCSRFKNCVSLNDLAESVRVPNCSSNNPLCRRIFDIQESVQFSKVLQSTNPTRALQAEQQKIRSLISERSEDFDRLAADLSRPDADLAQVRARYPELVSAINLENEITSKLRRLRGGQNLQPGTRGELTEGILDLELNATTRFDEFVNSRTGRLNSKNFANEDERLVAREQVRRGVNEALEVHQNISSKLQETDSLIASERARLARETNSNSRQKISERIITLTEQRSDILGAYKRLESTVSRKIRSFDFLTKPEQNTLLADAQKILRDSRTPSNVLVANARSYRDNFLKNGLDEANKKLATQFTDRERIAVAETVTEKPLTQRQRVALLEAHRIDNGGFSTNNPLNSRKGIILRRAGFSDVQTREIMRMGVAGRDALPDGRSDFEQLVQQPMRRNSEPAQSSAQLKNEATFRDLLEKPRSSGDVQTQDQANPVSANPNRRQIVDQLSPERKQKLQQAFTEAETSELDQLIESGDVAAGQNVAFTDSNGAVRSARLVGIDPKNPSNLVVETRDATPQRLSLNQNDVALTRTEQNFMYKQEVARVTKSEDSASRGDFDKLVAQSNGRDRARLNQGQSNQNADAAQKAVVDQYVDATVRRALANPNESRIAELRARAQKEGFGSDEWQRTMSEIETLERPYKPYPKDTIDYLVRGLDEIPKNRTELSNSELAYVGDILNRQRNKKYISPEEEALFKKAEEVLNYPVVNARARISEIARQAGTGRYELPRQIRDDMRAMSSYDRQDLARIEELFRTNPRQVNLNENRDLTFAAQRFQNSNFVKKQIAAGNESYVQLSRRIDSYIESKKLHDFIEKSDSLPATAIARYEVKVRADAQAKEFVTSYRRSGLDAAAATKLSDSQRIAVAERVTRRPLTPQQQDALIAAHKVDNGGFSSNNPLNSRKGIILRRAGFSDVETREIMRMGVAGSDASSIAAASRLKFNTSSWSDNEYNLFEQANSKMPPAIDSRNSNVLAHLKPTDEVTITTRGTFGDEKVKRVTVKQALEEAASSRVDRIRVEQVHLPLGRVPASVKAKISQELLSEKDIFEARIQFASGEYGKFIGTRAQLARFVNDQNVIRAEPWEWDHNAPPVTKLTPDQRSASYDPIEARYQQIPKENITTTKESDLSGATIMHGTASNFRASVEAGPRNIGRGYGGPGLYTTMSDGREFAQIYADKAVAEWKFRVESDNITPTEGDAKPVIMEGVINPDKNLTVGIFEIKRDGVTDISKGILAGVDWANDELLRRTLKEKFDILDLRGAARNEIPGLPDRMLVISERAGPDAIIWKSQDRASQNKPRAPAGIQRTQLTPEQKETGRKKLIEEYGSFQATTPEQNRAFISMRDASNESQKDRYFVYDDNTKLGEINNTTNNKLLANAVSYRRIDMVNQAMAELARQYNKVKITHVPYSGIKVSVHGFKTSSPDIELPEDFIAAANAKMSEINLQYYNEMKSLDLLPDNVDPMFLFRSGASRSYRSAEQGARKARTLPDGNRPRNLEEASVIDAAQRDMQFTQVAQQSLANRLNGTNLVSRDVVSGKMVFSQSGMDLIKKAKTPEVLIQQIKARTGVEINERTARLLIKHKADIDQPIPTTLIDERQSPILDSEHGGVNFDLVGAGAEGSFQSQLAFARSKNLDELFENQEIGERRVTEILNTRRVRVRSIAEPIMKKYGVEGRFVESGDDMAFVADNKPIPQRALDEIVQKLGESPEPSKVRMSAVGGGIKEVETRMNIGTQGEAIEKELRQKLIGQIPDEVLDEVLFAVKMETTQVGTGRARLMIGTKGRLTPAQRQLINNEFEQAAQKFNYNLSRPSIRRTASDQNSSQLNSEKNSDSVLNVNSTLDEVEGSAILAKPEARRSVASVDEKRMTGILDEMNALQQGVRTPEVKNRLNELNEEALQIVGRELDRQGIAYQTINPISEMPSRSDLAIRTNENALLGERKALSAAKNELSKPGISDFEAQLKRDHIKALEASIKNREDLQRAALNGTFEEVNRRQKISQTEGSLTRARLRLAEAEAKTDTISLGAQEAHVKFVESQRSTISRLEAELAKLKTEPTVADPPTRPNPLSALIQKRIVLVESPTNPPIINHVIRRYDADIVINPYHKSVEPRVLGAMMRLRRPTFIYPIESVLSGNTTLNKVMLHEIRHLHHESLKRKGVDLPYYVEIKTDKGFRLHTDQEGMYDEFMSFDELSTFSRDLSYTDSVAFANRPTRMMYKGRVLEFSDPVAERLEIAENLKILSNSASEAAASMQAVLKSQPEIIKFRISDNPEEPSLATIPYIRNGQKIGTAQVTLVKLNSSSAENKFEILNDYLNRVSTTVAQHQAKADRVLANSRRPANNSKVGVLYTAPRITTAKEFAESYVMNFKKSGFDPESFAKLTDQSRLAIAERVVDTPLNQTQKSAFVEAQKTKAITGASKSEIDLKKRRIMRNAGFSEDQTSQMLEMGILH